MSKDVKTNATMAMPNQKTNPGKDLQAEAYEV